MQDEEAAVDPRPNRRAFLRSFAVAGALLVAGVLALITSLGSPESAEGAGRAVGRLLFPLLLGALITGFIARRSSTHWAWWKYTLVVLAVSVVLLLLSGLGAMTS